jgi:hypothetical protein
VDDRRVIPLTEAAQRIGISWERAWRLLLQGVLRGEKRSGRWFVSENTVLVQIARQKRLRAEAKERAGRRDAGTV